MTATLTASRPIQQLPQELANQIAAGEVVERPASVVKELVENSLDAGATRIEISIQHGGLQSIEVRDNGAGIPREELPLAISRHATSKINSLHELENIQSLGFRGEALASIGSVSRMQLLSCATESESAWQIDCESETLAVEPASHPSGTSIYVRDLFYNTPARRKFMRTEKTEFRHVDEVVRRMALSHFDVGFSFKHNDRLIYQLAPANTDAARQRRVAKLCGKAFMDGARQLEFSAHGLRLWGWISGPEFSRSQNDLQHFYVNGRIIRDRLIMHAIRQVYQEWIHPGRHAAYLLHFEIDPSAVDVNVHPTKHEVRFHEARMVHDFIHRSLREGLVASNNVVAKAFDWQASSYQPQPYTPSVIAEPAVSQDGHLGTAKFLANGRFIVAENSQGLVIIDARRVNQQLIAKKLREDLNQEKVQSRPLLIPKNFFTTEAGGFESLEELTGLVRQLGFELSINGPGSVTVRKVPVVIGAANLQAVLDYLFSAFASRTLADVEQEEWEVVIQQIAQIVASTQEIDTSPEALARLLNQIEGLDDNSFYCQLDEQELEYLFTRN